MNEPSWTSFAIPIGSAILGAVVGGLITYIIQIKVLREERARRAKELSREQRTRGHSLIMKTIMIYSNMKLVNKHLEDSLTNETLQGKQPWECVQPLANPPDPVSFSTDELGMLLDLGGHDLFNLVFPLDRVHNTMLDSVQVHYRERTALLDKLSPDLVFQDRGQVSLSQGQLRRLQPQIILVNGIVQQLWDHAKRGQDESKHALVELHKLLEEKIGLGYKIEEIDGTTN